MLTLGQAAKEAGVSKSTLRRAIKSGRLFAVRNPKGHYTVTMGELYRAFPREIPEEEQSDRLRQIEEEIIEPHAEVEDLCGRLGLSTDQLCDARTELDIWQRHMDHELLEAPQPGQAAG